MFGWALLLMTVLGAGCLQLAGYEDARPGWMVASCADGMKNGDETGSDCGGSCSPCADGDGCIIGTDCASQVCAGGTCLAPTCDDKVQNEDETDVDCGGVSCPKCGPGKGCAADLDCKSVICDGSNLCVSTCTDGLRGGDEADVDCGGSCPGCDAGKACATNGDCESGVCKVGVCRDLLVWAKMAGDANSDQQSGSVAVDSMGNVVVGGVFKGALNWGTDTLMNPGPVQKLFLAKFTNAGSPLWAKSFGDGQAYSTMSIAADTQGNLLVAGNLKGAVNFGTSSSSTLVNKGPDGDIYVAKLDGGGGRLWSIDYGSGGAMGVVVDGGGDVYVAGWLSGSADFGTGQIMAAGSTDAFVIKLSKQSGTGYWSRQFGGNGALAHARALTVDGAGNVIVYGSFSGTIDFGAGNSLTSAGGTNMYLAKLDPDGNTTWARRLSGGAMPTVTSVGVDSLQNIILAGAFKGEIDFGGGPLAASVFGSVYVAKLNPSGEHVWSKVTASGATQSGPFPLASVTVDGADNVIIAGGFPGGADFGGGMLMSAGGTDAFVVKLAPDGEQISARVFGDSQEQRVSAVAADVDTVYVAGSFAGTIDLGSGPVASQGGYDAFVAKFLLP
ncbi:Multiple EGF-like-domain protein 3 precursor [Minicystis rosea]|nr:Multiple EGF-like-domain protein 3 precursor [Minicystis rosea]